MSKYALRLEWAPAKMPGGYQIDRFKNFVGVLWFMIHNLEKEEGKDKWDTDDPPDLIMSELPFNILKKMKYVDDPQSSVKRFYKGGRLTIVSGRHERGFSEIFVDADRDKDYTYVEIKGKKLTYRLDIEGVIQPNRLEE